ncbi:hypothetical protein KR52_09980 [Synechococcus sp. KORDI-52]|nr:hypothetical protein KR52_09980 [Synechococcus sp. KORDI-52]
MVLVLLFMCEFILYIMVKYYAILSMAVSPKYSIDEVIPMHQPPETNLELLFLFLRL